MERIPLRQLRNDVSRIVRRARAGERLVITVDGMPVAQIGPLDSPVEPTLQQLVAEGRLIPHRTSKASADTEPIRLATSVTTEDVLRELRSR